MIVWFKLKWVSVSYCFSCIIILICMLVSWGCETIGVYFRDTFSPLKCCSTLSCHILLNSVIIIFVFKLRYWLLSYQHRNTSEIKKIVNCSYDEHANNNLSPFSLYVWNFTGKHIYMEACTYTPLPRRLVFICM